MTRRRVSSQRVPGLTSGLLLVLAAILTACNASEAAEPCPRIETAECPELVCPKPPRYEDVWAASGHANERAEAFTHWNADDPPEIPVDCARCHSMPGHLDFLGADGTEPGQVDKNAKIGSTVTCLVCHNEVTVDMDSVVYPSGTRISGLGPEASCMLCHQGRASSVSVKDAIAEAGMTTDVDTVTEELGSVISHYASGATPLGAEAQGGYEYEGKTYDGRFLRADEFFPCIQCHDNHSLALRLETCHECHTFKGDDAREIRVDTTDYDGDGDVDEGIFAEIETIHQALYQAIQAYASDVIGTPIVHDPQTHPYFFKDTDGDGQVDPDEALFSNGYNAWTVRLLQAGYNYDFVSKDPGAYAHNSDYVIQILYDGLADLGGDTRGMVRP